MNVDPVFIDGSILLVCLKQTSLNIFAGLDEYVIAFSSCHVESHLP